MISDAVADPTVELDSPVGLHVGSAYDPNPRYVFFDDQHVLCVLEWSVDADGNDVDYTFALLRWDGQELARLSAIEDLWGWRSGPHLYFAYFFPLNANQILCINPFSEYGKFVVFMVERSGDVINVRGVGWETDKYGTPLDPDYDLTTTHAWKSTGAYERGTYFWAASPWVVQLTETDYVVHIAVSESNTDYYSSDWRRYGLVTFGVHLSIDPESLWVSGRVLGVNERDRHDIGDYVSTHRYTRGGGRLNDRQALFVVAHGSDWDHNRGATNPGPAVHTFLMDIGGTMDEQRHEFDPPPWFYRDEGYRTSWDYQNVWGRDPTSYTFHDGWLVVLLGFHFNGHSDVPDGEGVLPTYVRHDMPRRQVVFGDPITWGDLLYDVENEYTWSGIGWVNVVGGQGRLLVVQSYPWSRSRYVAFTDVEVTDLGKERVARNLVEWPANLELGGDNQTFAVSPSGRIGIVAGSLSSSQLTDELMERDHVTLLTPWMTGDTRSQFIVPLGSALPAHFDNLEGRRRGQRLRFEEE